VLKYISDAPIILIANPIKFVHSTGLPRGKDYAIMLASHRRRTLNLLNFSGLLTGLRTDVVHYGRSS
jgi:hypothetical protein